VTYYDNETRFTADLLEAAEYGGITGDWSRYRTIERRLAAETALAVLAQAQTRLTASQHTDERKEELK
jgi:hypothetical protein